MISVVCALALLTTPADPVLLFDQGFVIGQLVNGAWKEPSDKLNDVGVLTARGVGIGKLATPFEIHGVQKDDQFKVFVIGNEERPLGVFLSGRKASFPRAVRESRAGAAYLPLVKQQLVAEGLPKAKPQIAQVIRVDMDGDGQDEVLISATNCKPEDVGTAISGKPVHEGGDYSILLARYIGKNGKVTTQVLGANFKAKAETILMFNAFDALADFDGNGSFELLTSWRHYEGNGAQLWIYSKASGFKSALGAGIDS